MKRILFLCTGNSARSIMAEAYMNHRAGNLWRAYSAGSKPTGAPNPFALETLAVEAIKPSFGKDAPRSKSWDEFAGEDAEPMDVIVTVCDNAAAETCPVWPKNKDASPRILHWSFPDPAAAEGGDDDKRAAFREIFGDIKTRIDEFLAGEKQ